MMARPIAARVVPKVQVARVSRLGQPAFHDRDKRLREQSHVRVSNARARLHRRVNSAENEIISEHKKPWIKGAEQKVDC